MPLSQKVTADLLNVKVSTLKSYVALSMKDIDTSNGLFYSEVFACIIHYAMHSPRKSAKCKHLLALINTTKCHTIKELISLDEKYPFSSVPKAPNHKGLVYLISDGSQWYKIGKTKSIAARLTACQTGNPNKLEVLHVIKCANYNRVEYYLHNKFKDVRGRGEWFALSPDQVVEIISIIRL